MLGSEFAGMQQSSAQVLSFPQSHSSPSSTILLPQRGSLGLTKQSFFLFLLKLTFSLMLSLLHGENLSLLGSIPDVALSNMIKLPSGFPGAQASVSGSC